MTNAGLNTKGSQFFITTVRFNICPKSHDLHLSAGELSHSAGFNLNFFKSVTYILCDPGKKKLLCHCDFSFTVHTWSELARHPHTCDVILKLRLSPLRNIRAWKCGTYIIGEINKKIMCTKWIAGSQEDIHTHTNINICILLVLLCIIVFVTKVLNPKLLDKTLIEHWVLYWY